MHTPILNILLYFMSISVPIAAMAQCENNFASLIGSVLEDEKGYSLTASPEGKYIYVGGIKRDSAVILKISVEGQLLWTRTFDVVPGRQDHIHKLFVDSEGMIAAAGTAGTQTNGGSVFAFRYNPDANLILWAKQYISTSNNYCLGMIEKQAGGNYLLSNNPQSPNVAELIELERTTGAIVTSFSKHYDLGSSEAFYDFTWHNGALLASGRFSDGGSVAEMRNTLVSINPANGNIVWMKLGHRSGNVSARLYGFDLVVSNDQLYSLYSGDDNGESVDDTKIFLQKTDLNGVLLWVKEYDFPGSNDWADEILASDGGLVILGRNRVSPSDMYLFKVDTDGNILWAYTYDFFANDNATPIGSVQSQLIEAGQHLFFTAYAQETGSADMILVKAGLDGRISDTCLSAQAINPVVKPVANPVFYTRQPIVDDYVPQQISLSLNAGISSTLSKRTFCETANVQPATTTQSICAGNMFEGYSQSGTYTDTFQTASGCDSIRILELEVIDILRDTLEAEICPGQAFEGYTNAGTYLDTLSSAYGCDSLRTLILQVAFPVMDLTVEQCAGSGYNGYIVDGHYTDTIKGPPGGCDTIVNLSLHFRPPIQTSFEATICPGENYYSYSEDGWYTDTFTTPFGCDSIRTVHLLIAEPSHVTIYGDICDEHINGYHTPGMYTDTLISAEGCDSIRTLNLSGVSKYIPNVFSPNQDSRNDIFEVVSFPETEFELTYFGIFDRMGNMAYQVTTGPIYWDGRDKNGRFYNPGVFAYVLKYTCNSREITETGNITLIR